MPRYFNGTSPAALGCLDRWYPMSRSEDLRHLDRRADTDRLAEPGGLAPLLACKPRVAAPARGILPWVRPMERERLDARRACRWSRSAGDRGHPVPQRGT